MGKLLLSTRAANSNGLTTYTMPITLPIISKLSTPINILMALLIGYVLAQLTLDLLPRPPQNTLGERTTPNQQIARVSLQGVAEKISNAHLFGRVGSAPVVKAAPVQQTVPDTKLNLTLNGVLAYNPAQKAMAVISSNGRQEEVYAIGDKIVGNTTLQAVYPDRVIIRRSGKDETLRLPDKSAALGVINTQVPETNINQSGSDLDNLPRSAKALRERLLKEPTMLTDLISLRKYKRNGEQLGFRIQPKRSPELLNSFGIQPGDVITSVNGIALNNDRQGFIALGRLRQAKSVDLIVLRGGAEIPISVSLE